MLVLAGFGLITAGVLMIKHRQTIARENASALRNMFGRIANASVRKSTPGNVLFVGASAIVMGVVCLVAAVLRLT